VEKGVAKMGGVQLRHTILPKKEFGWDWPAKKRGQILDPRPMLKQPVSKKIKRVELRQSSLGLIKGESYSACKVREHLKGRPSTGGIWAGLCRKEIGRRHQRRVRIDREAAPRRIMTGDRRRQGNNPGRELGEKEGGKKRTHTY